MSSQPPPQIQVKVPPVPTKYASNGDIAGQDTNNGRKARLSADKALQFTPLTCSVLPLVDRIPIPEPARARENGRVATSSERAQAQKLFQQHNLRTIIQNEVTSMLQADKLSEFNFKLPPSHASNRSESKIADLGLSDMARSILNMTKVDYRYLTPDGAVDDDTIVVYTPKKFTSHRLPTPAEPVSPKPRVKVAPQQTFDGASITKPTSALVAQIPPPPPSYRREDYGTIQDSPKRRKLSHDGQSAYQSRTQKQQSDESLQAFQDLLNDIFEGQDLIDSAGGNILNAKSAAYFESLDDEGEAGLSLNMRTLDKLRDDLRRLLGLQRIPELPTDALRRLQQICESSIEQGQTINLRLTSDTSDDDLTDWRQKLLRANNSISSATVLLYTMIGNPQNDDLITLDALRWSSNALVNALESCLIPVIEARSDGNANGFFQSAAHAVDSLKQLLASCRRLLDLMATACIDVKGGDSCLNTIEFLAAKLIFVQNASHEKNSVLGLQTYETFRRAAMASLSRIYAHFPSERKEILEEVLSSLDKLPSTSRSARNFRTNDGRSIQLITALFMQLIQTTTMELHKSKGKKRRKQIKKQESDSEDEENLVDAPEMNSEDDSAGEDDPDRLLSRREDQLWKPAFHSASQILIRLIDKASKTTKTGDSPYRNILDLLVEDLISLLGNLEWPSAELMLSVLAHRMLVLSAKGETASVKNMAQESLGAMGSAVSKLRSRLPQIVENHREAHAHHDQTLITLAETYLRDGVILPADLVSMKGPFVMVAEYLQTKSGKPSLQSQSARAYFAAQFANLITQMSSSNGVQTDLSDVIFYAATMLADSSTERSSLGANISQSDAELAYVLCILQLRFCRRLPEIVKALSSSLSSDQAQVRSRSLKSISVILEIESSLLDRDPSVADDVFKCASDDSAMVRDSALTLIAKFIIPRGGLLERRGIERLLQCASDEKVGVQKRSIGHLKEIYQQEQRPKVKTPIAQTLFRRLADHEEVIVSLAEQTLEEILVRPATTLVQAEESTAAAVVAVDGLATTLMGLVTDEPQTYVPLLKKFLASLLRPQSKSGQLNQRLCAKLVLTLFEKIIATEKSKAPLLVLTALAEAQPKLVPPVQLSKLQVYLSDIQREGDLFMFRSAVDIFRLVLPDLSDSHKTLLLDIQNRLMQAVGKLARRLELDAVMQCLASIDAVLRNTERLVKLSSSALKSLSSGTIPPHNLVKLLQITGAIGRYVDLDKCFQLYQRVAPDLKGTSVSAYMVQKVLPLTAVQHPLLVRLTAFESLGSICQASPAQFNKPQVRSTLFDVLQSKSDSTSMDDQKLKSVVLNIFDELYAERAAAKEKSDKAATSEGQALKQMGGDARSRDQDSAISAITMEVVDIVHKISTLEISENALPAAKTLASISHQGLIHPKQCLGAFVAYGTSTNQIIAKIGHGAQHLLHEQHESHCEREYMSAIAEAFTYQHEVVHSSTGAVATGSTGFVSKLAQCFDIINMSNSKYIKKFLSGLVSRTTFDASSSEKSLPTVNNVLFTRFVMQNIAFFDYKKLDELLHVVLQLELAYSKSGGEIAAFIENAEQQYPDLIVHQQIGGDPELAIEPTVMETKSVDPALTLELQRLGPAAATLMLLIETRSHLIRQYGIGRDVRTALTNSKQAKDTNKSPTKVHGITGDKFWSRTNAFVASLDTEAETVQMCKEFTTAMSADDDFDMVDGSEMNGITSYADGDTSTVTRISTPGGRKRKLSATPGGTPTKKPRGRPRKSQTRRSTSISTNDDPDADFDG